MAVKSYFQQGGTTALITRVVSGSSNWSAATNTDISASVGATLNPFSLQTLGKGQLFNNSTAATSAGTQNSDSSLVSGSVDNLRWEITNVDNSKGTFTVLVRRGDDNIKSKVILETFNNVTLDPNADNYIAKVIGDQALTKASDSDGTIYLQLTGSYANSSNYVRVSAVNVPTYNYLGTDGLSVNKNGAGVSYSASLPQASSGSFYGAVGNNVQALAKYGSAIITGVTNPQGLVDGDYADAITLLENKDEFQFKVIVAPGLTQENNSTPIGNSYTVSKAYPPFPWKTISCIWLKREALYSSVRPKKANPDGNIYPSFWSIFRIKF